MYKVLRSCILLCVLLFCFTTLATALPNTTDYLPAESGEYVYYLDSSFPYEAYVGFLQYDAETYAVRYYAPEPSVGSSEVHILFTLNSDKDYTEMTGERIISDIIPDDTDTVNYLHDLIYELTARRRKITSAQIQGTSSNFVPFSHDENFPQFGGNVTLKYLFTVPIFNLTDIFDVNNKSVFSLVTIGRLINSKDKGFSNFTGIPQPLTDKERSIKLIDSNKTQDGIKTEKWSSFSILLDEQWAQTMENMWLLGNSAVLVLNTFTLGDITQTNISSQNSASRVSSDFLCRRMTYSTDNAYAFYPDTSIMRNGKRLTIHNRYYHPGVTGVTHDIKILIQLSDNEYGMLSLTVFDDTYKDNMNYFNTIVASFQ